jgi:hypothetical protein
MTLDERASVVPKFEGIEYLINAGLPLNARDHGGKTPLAYWRDPREFEIHWFRVWLIERLVYDPNLRQQRDNARRSPRCLNAQERNPRSWPEGVGSAESAPPTKAAKALFPIKAAKALLEKWAAGGRMRRSAALSEKLYGCVRQELRRDTATVCEPLFCIAK